MRHRKAGRKFSRSTAHRKAMFRSMLTSLFRHEKIRTTDAKAKELRRLADKMITLGKQGGIPSIRAVASLINDPEVVRKVFKEIAPRFSERMGGYTRVVKIGKRLGDGAEISLLEILEGQAPKKEKDRAPKAKKGAAAAAEKADKAGGDEDKK